MHSSRTKRGLPLLLACLALFSQYAPAIAGGGLLPAGLVQVYEGGDELGLRHPSDVLMTPDGRVLVLDGVSNRVVIYGADGRFQGAFGKGGKGEGELSQPLGMALDASGNLYIADSGNGRIQIYGTDGEYRSTLELPRDEDQKRPEPTGLAVDDKRGLLYVVDNENHRVLIYGLADRNLIGAVGKMSN
ncbi:MAG TPA: 6-bladed beta-propeller, partial [Gammaproteobacteria bacterium]|nr:6-bladed beta-propeller [Gammaproteobacteria bacterium]